jgi:hypothetical protein
MVESLKKLSIKKLAKETKIKMGLKSNRKKPNKYEIKKKIKIIQKKSRKMIRTKFFTKR